MDSSVNLVHSRVLIDINKFHLIPDPKTGADLVAQD